MLFLFPICILPPHVCCLYGGKIANMLCGNTSIRNMYLTTEYSDAVGPVKDSMPQNALKDLIWCMYFADDWNETGQWENSFILPRKPQRLEQLDTGRNMINWRMPTMKDGKPS